MPDVWPASDIIRVTSSSKDFETKMRDLSGILISAAEAGDEAKIEKTRKVMLHLLDEEWRGTLLRGGVKKLDYIISIFSRMEQLERQLSGAAEATENKNTRMADVHNLDSALRSERTKKAWNSGTYEGRRRTTER